jgi:hypothetical protein
VGQKVFKEILVEWEKLAHLVRLGRLVRLVRLDQLVSPVSKEKVVQVGKKDLLEELDILAHVVILEELV